MFKVIVINGMAPNYLNDFVQGISNYNTQTVHFLFNGVALYEDNVTICLSHCMPLNI